MKTRELGRPPVARTLVGVSLGVEDLGQALSAYRTVLNAAVLDDAQECRQAVRVGSVDIELDESTPAGWGTVNVEAPSQHIAGASDDCTAGAARQTDEPTRGAVAALSGLPITVRSDGHAGWFSESDGRAADRAHPLFPDGPVRIKVATPEPEHAGAALAAAVGKKSYSEESLPLNAVTHGVEFEDFVIDFVASRTAALGDLIGRHLREAGVSVFCLSIPVSSFDGARKYLVENNTPFTQWGKSTILLELGLGRLSLIELTG